MSYKKGTGRRRAAKVDDNQTSIVADLRLFGFSVKIMSQQGKGFPDLIVGAYGNSFLVEVKQLKGKLTADQIEFQKSWKGQYCVIHSSEEFLDYLYKFIKNKKIKEDIKKLKEEKHNANRLG